MNKTAVARRFCWLVVIGFAVTSVAYAVYARQNRPIPWCGNTLIDPLAALLNYGAPSAVGATVLLGMLSVRSWAGMRKVMLALALVVMAIFTLLACGHRLFLLLLGPNLSISEFVWWM